MSGRGLPRLLALPAVVLVVLLPTLVAPLSHDNELYQSMGWLLARFGRLPYVAAWDQNFPGIIYVHAGIIALFGGSAYAFRAIDLLAHLAVALIIARLSRRYQAPNVALYAPVLYALDYVVGGYWLAGQRDGFASLCLALAAMLYLEWGGDGMTELARSERLVRLRDVVVGCLMGLALIMRPTHALMIVALVAVVLHPKLTGERMICSLRIILAAAGLFCVLLWPILSAPGGPTELYLATVRFNADVYASLKFRGAWSLLWTRPRELVYDAVLLLWMWLHVVDWGLPTPRRLWQRVRSASPEVLLFAGFYVMSRLSVILMGKYFIHHYEVNMALTAMLAASVVQRLLRKRRWTVWRFVPALGLIAVLVRVYAVSMVPAFVSSALTGRGLSVAALHRDHPQGADDWENKCTALTTRVARLVRPGEAIEVWGWAPGLYWRTGTHPSSRFMMMIPLIMTGPTNRLADYQRAWQREYLDSLRSGRPAVFVVAKDTMGLHTFYDERPERLLRTVPGLAAWLEQEYVLDTVMADWEVYRRRSAGTK